MRVVSASVRLNSEHYRGNMLIAALLVTRKCLKMPAAWAWPSRLWRATQRPDRVRRWQRTRLHWPAWVRRWNLLETPGRRWRRI